MIPIQNVDSLPVAIQKMQPTYPVIAWEARIEGEVIINVLIDENGNVIQTAIIKEKKGSTGFGKAAEKAVKQWKFKPALKDGVAVKVWKPIVVVFKR